MAHGENRYRLAVHWIAMNDETAEKDLEVIGSLISVQLVADVWSKPTSEVARDVAWARRKRDPQWEPTPLRKRRA